MTAPQPTVWLVDRCLYCLQPFKNLVIFPARGTVRQIPVTSEGYSISGSPLKDQILRNFRFDMTRYMDGFINSLVSVQYVYLLLKFQQLLSWGP